MDKTNRSNLKKGQRVAFISVTISLFLAILKGTIGVLCNSQVLIADAIHSGADLMTHAASGVGLWIASSHKTETFPYGLYRAETFACLVVGILICLAGFHLSQEGYHKLFHMEAVTGFPIYPIAASAISSVFAYWIATMESKIGHEIGSKSLIASSKEAFLDIFTSLAVLVGIVLVYYQVPYAEGGVILIISLLLIKIGIENCWSSLLILMDANLEPELQQDISEEISKVRGVQNVKEVKIRQSGPLKMVDCIISTKPELSINRAHGVADKVEKVIGEKFEHIESTFIHMEPEKKSYQLVVIPVADMAGTASIIHEHFARAPYFLLVHLHNENIEVKEVVENVHVKNNEHLGIKTSRLINAYDADILLVTSIGEISFHMIDSNMIDIYRVQSGLSAHQALNGYLAGNLKKMNAPAHLFEASLVHKMPNNSSTPIIAK